MEYLSFNGLAASYDETRVLDVACFASALGFLVERYPPHLFERVFEPGIGTGRIAIPIVKRGYKVTGVDVSVDMLRYLKRRLAETGTSDSISYLRGDVTMLPFSDRAFDMSVAVHLFYWIRDWKTAVCEILRVTRDGGPVVLMHTGNGNEVPFLSTRYRELCGEEGWPVPQVGAQTTSEVVDYLRSLGREIESIRDRWSWVTRIELDAALAYMKRRSYSYTVFAPESIHVKVMKRLEDESRAEYGALSSVIQVPNQVYLVIVGTRR
jgi:ubiquinone/menaquinone biosynthesis C-methylase UbiE